MIVASDYRYQLEDYIIIRKVMVLYSFCEIEEENNEKLPTIYSNFNNRFRSLTS